MWCGNIFCLMAVSKPSQCTCRCEGEWHGAGRVQVPAPPVKPIPNIYFPAS